MDLRSEKLEAGCELRSYQNNSSDWSSDNQPYDNVEEKRKRERKKTQPRAIMDQEGASKKTWYDLKALNSIIKGVLFDYDQESNNILNKYR